MANADTPFGLRPLEYLNGSPYNGKSRMYRIPNTDTNAYAIGDPVALVGSADAAGVADVILGTAGSAVCGVIVGTRGTKYGAAVVDPAGLDTTVIPGTKTKSYYVLVADDPNIVFEVQEVSGGTALTSAAVGLNANLVAGTNNGYSSGWEVDNSTEATTATLNVKLLGLVQRSNNAFGEHAKWLVTINNHQFKGGTGTVGV